MKRILFYSLLILQAVVISLIAVQHALIGVYGTEIKLLQEEKFRTNNYYKPDYDHIDYEINKIDDDIWEIKDELDWEEKVYVVLKPNESGIYEAVGVTLEKPEAKADEVILLGRYHYSNDAERSHHVNYDIERINNYERQHQLNDEKQWIVTVKVAPWGQKKVIEIETE